MLTGRQMNDQFSAKSWNKSMGSEIDGAVEYAVIEYWFLKLKGILGNNNISNKLTTTRHTKLSIS